MDYSVDNRPDTIVISLRGEVDLHQSPTLRRVLLDAVAKGAPVLVEMQSVSYIDSSGVASLVEALQTARKRKTGFSLVAVSDPALRVLQLARLDKVFPILANLEAAAGSAA